MDKVRCPAHKEDLGVWRLHTFRNVTESNFSSIDRIFFDQLQFWGSIFLSFTKDIVILKVMEDSGIKVTLFYIPLQFGTQMS